uniref:Uncharacterized protein n=1 Tax=Timema shepardi TaxID=629360 RepID=A0A7R9G1C1_TIMSH|nr:unnamed protein product [Timema shepardi]
MKVQEFTDLRGHETTCWVDMTNGRHVCSQDTENGGKKREEYKEIENGEREKELKCVIKREVNREEYKEGEDKRKKKLEKARMKVIEKELECFIKREKDLKVRRGKRDEDRENRVDHTRSRVDMCSHLVSTTEPVESSLPPPLTSDTESICHTTHLYNMSAAHGPITSRSHTQTRGGQDDPRVEPQTVRTTPPFSLDIICGLGGLSLGVGVCCVKWKKKGRRELRVFEKDRQDIFLSLLLVIVVAAEEHCKRLEVMAFVTRPSSFNHWSTVLRRCFIGLLSVSIVAMLVAPASADDGTFFLKASKTVPRIGRRGDFDNFFLKASKSVPRIGRRGNFAPMLANALVVLSSTAEDGEIEVRISPEGRERNAIPWFGADDTVLKPSRRADGVSWSNIERAMEESPEMWSSGLYRDNLMTKDDEYEYPRMRRETAELSKELEETRTQPEV